VLVDLATDELERVHELERMHERISGVSRSGSPIGRGPRLHFEQDRLGVGAVGLGRAAETRHVEARLEPEAGAHRRSTWAVNRIAWVIGVPVRTACWIWAKFSSPGRIGRPAASAEVQPAGRSALERRFHTAPEPAVEPFAE
jgi:hypothetical protein